METAGDLKRATTARERQWRVDRDDRGLGVPYGRLDLPVAPENGRSGGEPGPEVAEPGAPMRAAREVDAYRERPPTAGAVPAV
jgi:hypothetical protein